MMWPGFEALPGFLAKMEYMSAGDLENGIWQEATSQPHNFFEWLAHSDADTGSSFHGAMSMLAADKADWTTLYPAHTLLENLAEDKTVLVDVGGGYGSDITRFRNRFLSLPPGSLILQDTPLCLDSIDVHQDIKTMAYDFFQPQPVKGV